MLDGDDIPVGFAACTILSRNNTLEGFIEDIYVEENMRNLKMGSELMRTLLSDLENREIDTVRVHVTKNNESVFPFYEKFGFELESCDDTGYLLVKTKQQAIRGNKRGTITSPRIRTSKVL